MSKALKLTSYVRVAEYFRHYMRLAGNKMSFSDTHTCPPREEIDTHILIPP